MEIENLRTATADLYRNSGDFPFRYARAKLRRDPVVIDLLLSDCLLPKNSTRSRLLDLGCGQGLLFAALDAWAGLAESSTTVSVRSATPHVAYAKGYDVTPACVRWGRSMLANRPNPKLVAEICTADIRTIELPPCDVVVVIDVLHYMVLADQEMLLGKIANALAPGGHLVLRVGDTAASWPSRISNWVDRVVVWARGQTWQGIWLRPMDDWQRLLLQLGFVVTHVKTYRSFGAVNILVQGEKAQ